MSLLFNKPASDQCYKTCSYVSDALAAQNTQVFATKVVLKQPWFVTGKFFRLVREALLP